MIKVSNQAQPQTKLEWKRFDKKSIIGVALIGTLYVLWTVFMLGFRGEHLFVLALSLGAYFGTEKSRKIYLSFAIFLVWGLIYDSMRVYPNYEANPVHIQQPYELEKSLFGILSGGETLTPNEYFQVHNNSFFDILTGLFYINWVPLPFFFAIYFYVKKRKELFFKMSYSFVFTSVFGYILYYFYPAAPPWYVALHGFQFIPETMGNMAEFYRFDELVGMPVFAGIYEKNSNVFAAIPSLHSSYPIVLFYYGRQLKKPLLNVFLVIFMFGIWFSAVYSGHHYIIDVLLGILCGIVGVALFEVLIRRLNWTPWKESRV